MHSLEKLQINCVWWGNHVTQNFSWGSRFNNVDLLSNNNVLEGGTLLAGDFKQILPMVPKESPANEENAGLKKTSI